jgi:hypothetical protein
MKRDATWMILLPETKAKQSRLEADECLMREALAHTPNIRFVVNLL